MRKIKDIIIFGEMGAGKSSVANYLRDNYDYTKLSLGEKIHSECKLHGQETREQMQQYGQAMREIFGESVWCDYLRYKTIGRYKVAIDDARQLNEYDYFTSKEYLPITVITDSKIRLERLSKRVNYPINPESFNHQTEVQARQCVEKCDIKIYNNGTYEDLIDEIKNKLGKYLEGGMQ